MLSAPRLSVLFLAAAVLSGCGGPAPVPPEALTLKADGSVPWVDEPIDSVYTHPAAPTVAPGSKPCTAAQLTGKLDRWAKPSGEKVLGGRLLGELIVTNTSGAGCVLQGAADVHLFSNGAEVPVDHSSSVADQAKRKAVPVPAGGAASMRVDWSGPFCGTARPPYELRVGLPQEGGELRAPIGPRDHPACSGDPESPVKPSSNLSASVFDTITANDPATTVRSPLWALTAAATGPAQAHPGDRLTYTVTLTNPTAAPVTLLPCPGFLQEVRSSAGGMVNGSSWQLYRLNCRPADAVLAHSGLRFEMVATVPATATAGGSVQIVWRVETAQLLPTEHLAGVLTIPVV
ncbi:DUF4232 domain-containing protein [Actinoplanes sp. NPDC026619]|uniref:DUF4232 domain-containing protein n=1 Tax=Actinoplanes sp. NPDC026619 TaxID=3155798 RepID=UPI0033EE4E00